MTKIDIFSGFLGAGKTTLIKKLISEAYTGEKLVLIENEFGETGIDGGFLKESGIQINEMNSGCICCSLVGDFTKALSKVLDEYKPDRILIEPSGVGKLSDVKRAVLGAESQSACLSSAVTVVDANKCKMYMKNFGEFFIDQVENAKVIILSRTANISQEKLKTAVELLREHNKDAVIITTDWNALSGKQILDAFDNAKTLEQELHEMEHEHKHHHHEHSHEHHHEHDENCTCGCHEHEHEHEHHHDHDHEHHHEHDENCTCGCHNHEHEHEHHHDHDHEHHHEHDENCTCGCHEHEHEHEHHHDHDHEHHHEHDENCTCGCHNHEHEHEHHHDHDHEHHHEHDENCTCGCHDHKHHHHHADEVFTSWGTETTKKFTKEEIENILLEFDNSGKYGTILRAKGIVMLENSEWAHFDYVPEEHNVRIGTAEITGKVCVIGSDLDKEKLSELFGI